MSEEKSNWKNKINQYVEDLGCTVSEENKEKQKKEVLFEKMQELKSLEDREDYIKQLKEEIGVLKEDLNM